MITLTINSCRECPYFREAPERDIRQMPSPLGGSHTALVRVYNCHYGELIELYAFATEDDDSIMGQEIHKDCRLKNA